MALHFFKGFGRPTELSGRSTREELPSGMAALLAAQLMLGPAHWLPASHFHPLCRLSSRRGHRQDTLQHSKSLSNSITGPNAKFFQFPFHGLEWPASSFPTSFQMPQVVNVPMKQEWGWEMKRHIFWGLKNNEKDREKKELPGDTLSRRRISKSCICPNPGRSRSRMPDVEQQTQQMVAWGSQDLLVTHLVESGREAKMVRKGEPKARLQI